MSWNKLSMAEKADIMKLAVESGIYNLDTIRSAYNEFAEGGDKKKGISDQSYYSTMEKVAEENYKNWGLSTPEEALIQALNDNTYNYREFYNNNPNSTANADTHWPDTYKTVYHPTFSDESIYSGHRSEYNPKGLVGGHWVGETFIPAGWQQQHANGGPIHIKPENRGKFTALKERTGHSATWFKEHGTPAQKKMATFALTSRHWNKQALGGPLVERANLYPIGGPLTNALASIRRAVNGSVIAASKAVINNSLNNMYQNTVGKYVFGNSSTERPAVNGALVGAKVGVPTTQVVNPDYTDLVDFLTADRNEGFLAEPTDIGDGKITIGSGLTNKKWLDLYKQRGNVWSKEDNRAAVLEEIKERSARLAKSLPNFNTLPLDSQKALISYDYNVGMSPNNHPNLWKAAKNKDWGTVANEMNATSKNPNFVKGLERRRKEEQDWFRRGFKAYGGNLYGDGGSSKENHSQQMNQPNLFRRNGEYFYQASPDSEEITVTPVNTLFDDPALWTYTDNNGRLYTPRKAAPYTQGTITEKEDEGPLVEAAKNYLGELQYDINNGIPIGGKYTMPAIAASALLPLAGEAFAGTSIAGIPATTWADAALTAGFGAHGLNHLFNEGIDGYGDAAMTALEIAPLGRLVRPMWNTTKNNARAFYNNLTMDLTSTPGTYYVGYPERDLSTLMPGKTGGIFLTPDKKFARGYTGAFGTGKVYETKVNFGENPIHIDAKGRYFDEIAEQDVLDAFNTTVEEMKELGLKPFYTKKGLFSKKPPQRYYHIDDVSAFGKKKGASSLIVDNVFDQGPGIFGFGTKGIGQQVVVYSPKQISLLKESHPVKSAPQITADNAASTSDVMADASDFSYKGLTSNTPDLFEKWLYNNKIHGKPSPSEGGVAGFSKSVQTGIPETEYNELLHDVIGRNVREFKRAGLNDAQINNYINNAKDAMNGVHIGMYSDSDYIKGGWEGFGGFYDSKGNFISINTGSPLPRTKIVKHEGRHLLDHKVDDEILMPTSESAGNDFDSDMALSTMQKVKQNQNMILYDAYDNDFMTLPSKEGFNEGLEGYPSMSREAITTNLDSRNELLGSKANWDFDITDKIIDKMSDDAVFEAVEKANGYGRRFIRFLRENNKLTPEKAKQFREAMKHVGTIATPVSIGYGLSQGNE